MANSKRKCKHCKDYYPAADGVKLPAGWFHEFDCALLFAANKQDKARVKASKNATKEFNRETKRLKAKIKTRGDWTREAQAAFNRFIRLRDDALPCISCLRFHDGQFHAGHFLSVGANPELRFDEFNCHKQCAPCNNHLSGNIANYRPNLFLKIGADELCRLEGPHDPLKLTIDDIKAIKENYNRKYKELIKDTE